MGCIKVEIVILISGLGTCIATVYLAFFASKQLDEQRIHHKQKSTVELLISNNNNPFYREQRKLFVDMRRNGKNFTALACKINESGAHEGENATILAVLNSIEFICVGIKEDIFDEAVYKRMSRSSVINDWNTLKPYVMELRRSNGNNKKLFCEFEWLAEKWIEEDK
jgi:hypothetical protein|nr:MAG TPA: protein of unknown function (DUF4760) [Caudoviricetes sp.]